jgi:hypothetical protein
VTKVPKSAIFSPGLISNGLGWSSGQISLKNRNIELFWGSVCDSGHACSACAADGLNLAHSFDRVVLQGPMQAAARAPIPDEEKQAR